MATASRLGREPGQTLQREKCQTAQWALPESCPGGCWEPSGEVQMAVLGKVSLP